MIRQLTYKKKFFFLAGAVVTGMVIVFKVAIKPSILLVNDYNKKKDLLESLSTAPQEIRLMTRKLEGLNAQLSSTKNLDLDIREDLLSIISNYCSKNRITVSSFPQQHLFSTSSFFVESNRIILKGKFKSLLKLVHYMETEAAFSKIVSIYYYTDFNRKNKREELFLEIIFQNIKDHE